MIRVSTHARVPQASDVRERYEPATHVFLADRNHREKLVFIGTCSVTTALVSAFTKSENPCAGEGEVVSKEVGEEERGAQGLRRSVLVPTETVTP